MATRETPANQAIDTPRMTFRDRLSAWREIMQTANPPQSLPLDTVGKWLVMTRAVFYNEPRLAEPPSWYPARGRPLWFVGFAFRHTRLCGGLLTLGLLANVLVPVRLPLPWV